MPPLPQRKHKRASHQTKLNFAPSSSPAPAPAPAPAFDDDEDSDESDHPKNRRGLIKLPPGGGFFGLAPTAKRARSISDHGETDEEEKLKQKIRDKKKGQSRITLGDNGKTSYTKPRNKSASVEVLEDEQLKEMIREKKRKGREISKAAPTLPPPPAVVIKQNSIDVGSQKKKRKDKSKRKRSRSPPHKKSKVIAIDEDEDSDAADDVDIGQQYRSREINRVKRSDTLTAGRESKGKKKKVPSDDEEDEDEDDLPVTPIRRRIATRAKVGDGSRHNRIGEQVEESKDEEDEDDEIPTRRLRHSSLNPRPTTGDPDSDDIGSDAELAATTPKMPSRTRMGQPKKLTPFQKKLALLKAKRSGQYISGEEDEEEEDDTPSRALYDSSSVEGEYDDDEDEDSAEEVDGAGRSSPPLSKKPLRHRRSSFSYPDSENDSDIADFIVSDVEAPPKNSRGKSSSKNSYIGQYDPNHIPIQFTSHSHASASTHFKTATFFLIQQILLHPSTPTKPNPFRTALADQDEYTQYAFHFLDRKINSFRDSVLASSAWAPNFLLALKNRPGFSYDEGTGNEMEHCSACNRRDKHATFAIMFTGNVYDHSTLIDIPPPKRKKGGKGPVEQKDAIGNVIPPATTRFPVGRFCFERAEITHSFWHWKKGLRVALEEMLSRMGVLQEMEALKNSAKNKKPMKGKGGSSDEGESESDGHDQSQEAREERAVAVMKQLDQDGDIHLMYDMFEAQIKRAEEFISGNQNSKRRYIK